ncbi:MAG: lecithin retinol acyltransferase family protein [Clostridiales bacterium]|nr:lecithin retinol acyltransferase family protein [Clostridiales bacterium]
MSHLETNDLMYLLDFALGIAKDKAFEEALQSVQTAQREYLIADADARRVKTRATIQQIAKLDVATRKLEFEYIRVKPMLTPDTQTHLDRLLEGLSQQRHHLVQKKKSLPASAGALPVDSEHINGIRLIPGDILAVSRKSGLYQHFAVYIGGDQVIHYAAKSGDFAGRITIHEAPLSEFRLDSTCIYILDFPDNLGYPTMRTLRGNVATPGSSQEGPFFRLIRETEYHLYSPEETIARAKSRLGEENYNLAANNCEHFALWCKTGVRESHQVNVWITRLLQYANKYICS